MLLLLLAGVAPGSRPPEPDAPCTDLWHYYAALPLPARPERPALWWLDPDPCPFQTVLTGAPPPGGAAVWCADRRDRAFGPRTQFQAGRIVLVSAFERDVERGPRNEWDVAGRPIRHATLDRGALHGPQIEWTQDGGITATSYARGEQHGPTWRISPQGALSQVEHYVSGAREGRSCTWRDEQLQIDQLWEAGAPLSRVVRVD